MAWCWFKKLTFKGKVTIAGSTVKSTNEITLHSKDLEITDANINNLPVKVNLNTAKEEVV